VTARRLLAAVAMAAAWVAGAVPGALPARANAAVPCIEAAGAADTAGAAGPRAAPVDAWTEPPPEQAEGGDYELEPADSLDGDTVELGVGASGRAGSKPRQTRRVRFSDRTTAGSVREGEGDPLAGGTLETGTLAGRVGVGRLAPRWGRGLLLGAAAEPWSVLPDDRGAGAAFRGRAGRGAWYRAGEGDALETLCGRFGTRELAGGRVAVAGVGCGLLADRDGGAQAELSLERGGSAQALALDRRGRWRAEAAVLRSAGTLALAARVRGGLAGFRSLAEPLRSGPCRALAVELRERTAWGRVGLQSALWRFGRTRGGARSALEVRWCMDHHESFSAGLEERHGTPRERGRVPGFRQGGWVEWQGGASGLALALRHEVLGAKRLGRAAVRTVTAARVGVDGPAGSALTMTHCVYRVRSGESLYLVEGASDRVVLKAVSGAGQRTRVELRGPGAGGRVNAALEWPGAAGTRSTETRPRWTLEWTRRARGRTPG
jgi:hypothetical protein